jgi:hypothetical protein
MHGTTIGYVLVKHPKRWKEIMFDEKLYGAGQQTVALVMTETAVRAGDRGKNWESFLSLP